MVLRQIFKRFNPIFMNTVRFYSNADKLVNSTVNDKTKFTTITLQRPPVNSLNYDLLYQLLAAIREAGKKRTKGVILTSSSPTVFSSGLDIMEIYKPTQDRLRKFWTTLQDVCLALYGAEYPTVAAINGHAPAGGCFLALCCEYRIMLPKFTIGLNETQLGIVAPDWLKIMMRNTIGNRRTELALTQGRIFTTNEALEIGLIDEIANDRNELIAKSEEFLMRFAKIPLVARNMTKLTFRSKELKEMEETREQDLKLILFSLAQSNVQKGLGMYMEFLKKKAAK